MKELHIITPVKDSIESTLLTIEAIMASQLSIAHTYTVYNDFSTPENTARLEEAAKRYGFRLVNLSDLTSHPSPNYLLVLQTVQREALATDAGVCIVESDVIVRPDTLQRLVDGATAHEQCGIAASVTVDDNGDINYPYLYAKGMENRVVDTKRHCSFAARCSHRPCCALMRLRSLIPKRTGSTSPYRTSRSSTGCTIICSPRCRSFTVRTKAAHGNS